MGTIRLSYLCHSVSIHRNFCFFEFSTHKVSKNLIFKWKISDFWKLKRDIFFQKGTLGDTNFRILREYPGHEHNEVEIWKIF